MEAVFQIVCGHINLTCVTAQDKWYQTFPLTFSPQLRDKVVVGRTGNGATNSLVWGPLRLTPIIINLFSRAIPLIVCLIVCGISPISYVLTHIN